MFREKGAFSRYNQEINHSQKLTQALWVVEWWLQGEGMLTGGSEIHGDIRPGHRATF